MQKPFLEVLCPDDARRILRKFTPLSTEQVAIDEALFRVTSETIRSVAQMPPFDRSTMDGYSVRSIDTFGATESNPALLNVVGEINMGETKPMSLSRSQAVRIWTGGALPNNSDAVVMIEHTQDVGENTIEVLKAVAPFDNVVRKGEDFRSGETLLSLGHRLRPQDLGLLAALGRPNVRVFRKPKIAVISSGDEIVPIEHDPPPGCVRDINRHTLTACVIEAHAEPIWIGIAPDRLPILSDFLVKSLKKSDLVLISGGSSMGSRDFVIEAIRSLDDSEILVHGVSLSPGKPLIIGQSGRVPVVGLPGHPVSAMVCFEQFVVPIIRRLEGENVEHPFVRPTIQAILARNLPSKEGRLDLVRVKLKKADSKLTAMPVPGKSGMISAMVRADGFIRIPENCEGLYKGDSVNVNLFSPWLEDQIAKEYLLGHEASSGGVGALFEPVGQEKLSGH
jgi:molybdopterin molybdotransferase